VNDLDLSEEEQGRRLISFMDITQTDSEDVATRLLEGNNWNVETAVSSFLDSSSSSNSNSNSEHMLTSSTGENPIRVRRRRGSGGRERSELNNDESRDNVPGSSRSRVVGSDSLSLSTMVGKISDYTSRLVLSPIRRITGVNGDVSLEEAARQFTILFEKAYGETHPRFKSSSYKDAITSSHNSEKLLLVYLHSPKHPDTDDFCKNVLCSEEVSNYVNTEMLAWGGSIEFADAYRLCDMMMVSTYPTLAVLQPSASSSSSSSNGDTGQRISARLLDRIDGITAKETIIERLSLCCRQHKAVVQEAAARRLQEQERRNLLEQQNREYLESQRRDREREEEKRRQQEEERNKVETMKKKREQLPNEPPSSVERRDSSTIKFNLPNGTKFVRRFYADNKLQHVRDFVEITLDDMEDNTIANFELVMNFPKRRFGGDTDHTVTIEEAGLVPQAVLFVQDLDS